MWLLNSAVEKLPDISGLINRIVYDKNSPNYRKQKCGTGKNLSLWYKFTKEILDQNGVKQFHCAKWQEK